MNVLTGGLQFGAQLGGVDREILAVDVVQDRFVDGFPPDDFQRDCRRLRFSSAYRR